MARYAAALAVAYLAVGALAGPISFQAGNQCAVSCGNSKTGYEEGKTYIFDYSADVETTITGATDEASRLHMTATVEITPNSACDFTMKLSSVTLKDSDPKDMTSRQAVENMDTFSQELERFPISFSFEDGKITSVCSNEVDAAWVVNIKRGILSTGVTVRNMEEHDKSWHHEEDISGTCLATVSVQEAGNGFLVTKDKDLMTCSDRGHLSSVLQSSPYTSEDSVSMPLLKSDQHCEQKFVDGRMKSVLCHETHLFRPYSTGDSGAMTKTTVKMTETGVRSARRDYHPNESTVRSSLVFDYSEIHDKERTVRDVTNQAMHILEEITVGTADDVRPNVPRLFSKLVHLVRHLSERDIMALNNQITSEETRRYLVDALPLAGTGPALQLMRQMIMNGDVSDKVADKWMTSLAFVHDPTLSMVAAVAPLVSAPAPRRQTLLGVSSLVHNYCKQNAHCSSDEAVRMVVSHLEKLLSTGCSVSSEEDEMNILAVLKALGNAGQLLNGSPALQNCFRRGTTMDVRLAAVRAYRRMSCNTITESGLIKTFENPEEDTEIRIAAYLTVMKCPSTKVVDKVLEILSHEDVSQVSSFVWSHLHSMKTSRDPNQQTLKSLLYNVDLAKKYSPDLRKFSRYFQRTFFLKDLNVGTTVDADVIFSPESYIPRSGKLNFTIDLFGQNVNLLEIGGRVEGLEDFSESLFGEKGVYPVEALSAIMKGYSSSNRIHSPKASTYMKIFGNELKFNKYDSLKELMDSMKCDGPIDFLKKLAQEMDWTENYQFLDSSYTLPTIAGFTFMLKAEGTASVSIKTGGKFDIQSWTNINIDGHVKPSAAINIRSEMKVDAHVAHTGLKMDANMHTSTVFEGHAIVEAGNLVSVRVNMPRDKVEVLDVTTRFHTVHRNKAVDLTMNNGEKYELQACSDKYIPTDLLGLNFCTDVMYTRPSEDMPKWMLAGPVTARFMIEKTDTLKAFEFEYRHSDKSGIRKSSLVLDTPGSTVHRRISFDYMINFISKSFQVGFVTPIKSGDLTGTLNTDGATKQASASLKVDNKELFGFDGQLQLDDNAVSVRYAPSLTVRGPSGDLVTIDAGFIANKNKFKYNTHLTISKIFETPVVFKGDLNEVDNTYSLTSSLESFVLNANTQGTFRYADDNLLVQTTTDYSLLDGERQTIRLNGKLGSEVTSDEEYTYKVFLDTKFSAMPILDTQFNFDYVKSESAWEGQLGVKRGEREYQLTSTCTILEDTMAVSLGFVADHWDVDFKLGGAVDLSEKHKLAIDLEGQLRKEKFAKFHTTVVYKNEDYNFQYGLKSSLTLPSAEHNFEAGIRREETAGHLKMVASCKTPEYTKEYALITLLEVEESQVGVDLTLSIPSVPRMQASATVIPGTKGVYMAKALGQYADIKYSVGGELKLPEKKLELFMETPLKKYSAMGMVTRSAGKWMFNSDIRFGRRVLVSAWTNTDMEFKNANFEVFWNKDFDDSQKATFELVRRSRVLAAVLNYPGNQIKLDATLTADGATVDLQYTPGKVINVRAESHEMQSEQGWRTFITATTPIEHYRTLSLEVLLRDPVTGNSRDKVTFEVIGELEDQRIHLTGGVAAYFQENQHFNLDLKLTTPFRGWETNKLTVDYAFDDKFAVSVTAEKNTEVFSVGGAFELKTYPTTKVHTFVEFILPIPALEKAKIGFDFKLAEEHFAMDVMTMWKRFDIDRKLGLSVNSRHSFQPFTLDSSVTVDTPFHHFEHFNIGLLCNLNENSWPLTTQITVARNAQQVFHAEFTSESWAKGKFVLNCAGCEGIDFTYMITPPAYMSREITYGLDTIAHYGEKEYEFTYKVSTNAGDTNVKTEISSMLRIPEHTFKMIQKQTVDREATSGNQYVELAWNAQKIVMDVDLKIKQEKYSDGRMKSMSITSYGKLQTPFDGWRSAHISRTQTVTMGPETFPMQMDSTTQLSRDNEVSLEMIGNMKLDNPTNWEWREETKGNTKWVKHAISTMKLSATPSGPVKFTMNSEWDGKTAYLTYSHRPQERPYDDFDMSMTGKWYSGTAKTAHLHLGFKPSVIEPTLSLTDEAIERPLQLVGTLSSNWHDGRSELFLSGLFSERVGLTATYSIDNRQFNAMLEYHHTEGKQYSAAIKSIYEFERHALFDLDLKAPADCMGTAHAHLEYENTSSFILKGELSRNAWKTALNSRFGSSEGLLEITTPYDGFKTMSFSYTCGDACEIRFTRENRQIRIVAEHTSSTTDNTDQLSIRVNTPYHRFENMVAIFTSDRDEAKFTIDYTRGRYATVSVITDYAISGPKSSVNIKAETSYPGYSNLVLEFSYDLIKQNAMAKFDKEGHAIEIVLDADLSLLNSNMKAEYKNTLLPSFEQLVIAGDFDFRDAKKTIDASLTIDNNSIFEFETKAKMTETESFFKVEVESPVSFGKAEMDLEYKLKSDHEVEAKFELTKGEFAVTASFNYEENSDNAAKITLIATQTPFEFSHQVKLSAEIDMDAKPQTMKLTMENDSDKYDIVAEMESGDDTCYITVATPFTGFEKLGAWAQKTQVGDKNTMKVVLSRNEEKIEAMLERELENLLKPLVLFKISTPFPTMSSLTVFVKYDLVSEQKQFHAILARNDKQIKISMFASVDGTSKATTLFDMETPFTGWEQFKINASYDFTQSEKMLDISYEKNGVKKVLATRGGYDAEKAYIDLITPIEGYERMGISGQYVSRRGKREAGYEGHVNGHRHRVYILYERKGMDSAKLKIETPIEDMHLIEADIRTEKFDDGMGVYINTNRDNQRSSAEIRTVGDGKKVGVDVTIRSYIEGLENLQLSGNIVYRGKKRSFSFRSSKGGSEQASISGQLVMRKKGGNGSLTASLPMVPALASTEIDFDYKLGNKKSFSLTSTRNGVTRKFSGDLTYTKTSIDVNLNTPYEGFTTMHADASRSTDGDGRISASLNLQREARKIEIAYDYLFSKTGGSGKISAKTPYEGFTSMMCSLEYNIGSSSRSLTFKANRGDRNWSISTSRTWENGVDTANMDVSTPLEQLRTLSISRTFDIADLANMKYDATYERNGNKFTLGGTGSVVAKGKKIDFDITITTPLKIKKLSATVKYDFRRWPGTIYAKFQAGKRYAQLDANIGTDTGSATLQTTNENLPKLDINYNVLINPMVRDINIEMKLADGRQLTITYNADHSQPKKANGVLDVVSTTYGVRKLTWEYDAPNDDLSGKLTYESPNGSFHGDFSMTGKAYERRKITLTTNVNIPDVYVSSQTTTFNYNLKNGVLLKLDVDYNGKSYKAYFNGVNTDDKKRKVEITYDGQMLKDIRIDATWTIPTAVEGRKEFDITYKRGNKQGTLSGFINLGSHGKSGTLDIDVTSTHVELKKLHANLNWDMILPNRIFNIDYERNGKRFAVNLTGSRYDKHADYSITASFPPWEVRPGKFISQYEAKFSFDLRTGYKFMYAKSKPVEETLEFDLKFGSDKRNLKVLYDFKNTNELVSYMPPSVYIHFSSERTERPQGPKIAMELKTGFQGFELVTVDIDVNKVGQSKSITIDYKRGSITGKLEGTVEDTDNGKSVSFTLNTPIQGFEEVTGSGSYEVDHGKSYKLNLNYARGQKFVRLTSSVGLERPNPSSGSLDLDIKFDSYITMPVDLLVTIDGSMSEGERRKGNADIKVVFNGDTYSLSYTAEGRADRREMTTKMIIQTPHKPPYKKMVYTSNYSLLSNKANWAVEYGRKKIDLGVSWFQGEADQYGAEIRLSTPFKAVRLLELDAKGTVRHGEHPSIDVMGHYLRNDIMIHVTGNVRPYAADLDISSPWGNANVKAGVKVNDNHATEVMALFELKDHYTAGFVMTLKLGNRKDMEIGIDIHTPIPSWQRFNIVIGYTNLEDSNIVKAVFDSPVTKRVELSFELTNHTDSSKTDFRAGVTTNYLGKAFTFRTHILRDAGGMKYELEIESPFHILPSFKLRGRS